MLELRPIHNDSIPRAMAKAERYRLLNEPFQAESICRDVLAIDGGNQQAIICLILSITDMFAGSQTRADDARPLVQQLTSEYDRLYYAGVVDERWARSLLFDGYPPSAVHDLLLRAMGLFEQSQARAEPGNDDAILRWNACLRFMQQHHVESDTSDEQALHSFDDDVPMR